MGGRLLFSSDVKVFVGKKFFGKVFLGKVFVAKYLLQKDEDEVDGRWFHAWAALTSKQSEQRNGPV